MLNMRRCNWNKEFSPLAYCKVYDTFSVTMVKAPQKVGAAGGRLFVTNMQRCFQVPTVKKKTQESGYFTGQEPGEDLRGDGSKVKGIKL